MHNDLHVQYLLEQNQWLEDIGLKSVDTIDGFQDFIFVNRFGHVQHQGTLNKAIKRIVRDANFDALEKILLLTKMNYCLILVVTF